MEKLIEHHTKYKEIHGVDETIWITKAQHMELHRKLRREGKCNIPTEEMHKIAKKAHKRTEKGRRQNSLYNSTKIDFQFKVAPYIGLEERIQVYPSGSIAICTRFRASKGKHFVIIDI